MLKPLSLFGKALLAYAIHHQAVYLVDVNEQNEPAVGFIVMRGLRLLARHRWTGKAGLIRFCLVSCRHMS